MARNGSFLTRFIENFPYQILEISVPPTIYVLIQGDKQTDRWVNIWAHTASK
jgi:hypothetical protein